MKASLLDRLLDTGPDTREESALGGSISFGQLRSAVERDLENLLNSRCFPADIPASYTEVRKSLLLYGFADFTSRNPTLPSVQMELRQEMERTIALFEPRLQNVRVRVEVPTSGERRLLFKISALLKVEDEIAEPVVFDTFFDSNRCEYCINR